MRLLLPYLKPYRRQAVLGPVAKLLEAAIEIMLPILMAWLLDAGVGGKDYNVIYTSCGIMLLISVLGLGLSLFCQYSAAKASHGMAAAMRTAFLARVQSLAAAQAESVGLNSLLTRASSDINNLQKAVDMIIRLVSRIPFILIGSVIAAIIIDPMLSLVMAAFIPLYAGLIILILRKTVPLHRKTQDQLDGISGSAKEALSGVRVIRAYNRSAEMSEEFGKASDKWHKAAARAAAISAFMSPVTLLLINAGIVAILWAGGYRVTDNHLSGGELLAFINYMTQISGALLAVANLTLILTRAAASLGRVKAVFSLEPDIQNPKSGAVTQPEENAPAAELRGASFSYAGGAKALKGVSFKLGFGKTLGIVGGTGAGKSTAAQLILRLYDAEGCVFVGGADVRDWELNALRGMVGYVPQRASLFEGTVRENILVGRPDATDEDIRRALKNAQALDFISELPDGLEHKVRQGGVNFSGGQRQRLTVARALVREPRILILDDSSSALDYVTDSRLRQALKTEYPDAAKIIISQRVNAVKDSDEILVLHHGAAAGSGTHSFLLESCPEYRELYLTQNGGAHEE